MRPVVGVGADVIRTIRRSGPRRPEEEGRQLAESIRVGNRSGRNRIVRVAVREDFGVMGKVRFETPRLEWGLS